MRLGELAYEFLIMQEIMAHVTNHCHYNAAASV